MKVSVGQVSETEFDPIRKCPELFTGLGRVQHEYRIHMDPEVKPCAVSAPRRVPIPLMDAVGGC